MFVRFAFLAGCWLALASSVSGDAVRPNIIVILVDDMGYSDIGCYGGEIETPISIDWQRTVCGSRNSTTAVDVAPLARA